MTRQYTILLDESRAGVVSGRAKVTEQGAKIIWAAYDSLHGSSTQSMDRREERGGICWLSEINFWKSIGKLPIDFNWKDYEIKQVVA